MSKKLSAEEFITKARSVHGDKYDYSKVEYVNAHTKVKIICKEHGCFMQTPNSHLNGKGCPKCNGGSNCGVDYFIEKSKQIHGDKYDYSKVEYSNAKTKVCIICPKHGEFWQTPQKHLLGQGCRVCANNNKLSIDEFNNRAFEIHGDKYDYSKVEYINKDTKVLIKCNKCGFWFNMTPRNHIAHKEGCPNCRMSKLESDVEKLLIENSIEFEKQKVFDWLIDGKKIKRIDFYLPKYNIAIECQGLQHFKSIKWFGGEEHFQIQKSNDELKRKLCESHNIKILYYSNLNIEYPYEVISDKNNLIREILDSKEN